MFAASWRGCALLAAKTLPCIVGMRLRLPSSLHRVLQSSNCTLPKLSAMSAAVVCQCFDLGQSCNRAREKMQRSLSTQACYQQWICSGA